MIVSSDSVLIAKSWGERTADHTYVPSLTTENYWLKSFQLGLRGHRLNSSVWVIFSIFRTTCKLLSPLSREIDYINIFYSCSTFKKRKTFTAMFDINCKFYFQKNEKLFPRRVSGKFLECQGFPLKGNWMNIESCMNDVNEAKLLEWDIAKVTGRRCSMHDLHLFNSIRK